jgi:hypothetical protein
MRRAICKGSSQRHKVAVTHPKHHGNIIDDVEQAASPVIATSVWRLAYEERFRCCNISGPDSGGDREARAGR